MSKTSVEFPTSKKRQGLRWGGFVLTAIVFTVVGILLASNLDLTTPSRAQVPSNVGGTGAFPIVNHDGRAQSPFVEVVEKYANAVVNIAAESRTMRGYWWHPAVQKSTSLGSGFFFRDDGYILTNNHVVENADAMTVRTAAGYEYEARLVAVPIRRRTWLSSRCSRRRRSRSFRSETPMKPALGTGRLLSATRSRKSALTGP